MRRMWSGRTISRRRALFVTAAAIALVAVGVGAVITRIGPEPLTWTSLLNATYSTSVVPRGAQLRDGVYDVAAAPGSASRVVVRLADMAAFGDIDGDGDADVAAILTSSGGGSG